MNHALVESTDQPVGRVVLLGASNLVRGLPTVVEVARLAWRAPLDILVAGGHGRSYGADSVVLGRQLGGIATCALWDELQLRSRLPTAALLTDVGNDLVYGHSVDQILAWLEICLSNLADHVDRLVITRLPIETLEATTRWQFQLLSNILFPGSRLDRAQILGDVRLLNQHILQFAGRFRAYVIHPQPVWYGWDPIHIRRRWQVKAWRSILGPWTSGRLVAAPHVSLGHRWRVRRARPLHWRMFGIERRRAQPCVQLSDGSTLSLY